MNHHHEVLGDEQIHTCCVDAIFVWIHSAHVPIYCNLPAKINVSVNADINRFWLFFLPVWSQPEAEGSGDASRRPFHDTLTPTSVLWACCFSENGARTGQRRLV